MGTYNTVIKDEYNGDGWIMLAQAIVSSYADEYAELFPRNAISQEDYTTKDLLYYKKRRDGILNRVRTGPVKHLADYAVCKRGFDMRREECKRQANIHWIG